MKKPDNLKRGLTDSFKGGNREETAVKDKKSSFTKRIHSITCRLNLWLKYTNY